VISLKGWPVFSLWPSSILIVEENSSGTHWLRCAFDETTGAQMPTAHRVLYGKVPNYQCAAT
jgi:hypothetical protein